ncbi:MAG: rod shape-determining protein MreC [Cytophagales bacterium]
MNKVIQFLVKRINFIAFLFFQIICFTLIFSNSPYQSSSFFNSSNEAVGNVLEVSNNTKEYLKLKDINEQLAVENAKLHFQLSKKYLNRDNDLTKSIDTTYTEKYKYVAAKVINNSTNNFKNYLTINKGWADSLAPGMGVICDRGIVGKVKACSKNYSTITSVLNRENMISSKLKNSNAIGSVRWDGINANIAKMLYVPRHLAIKKGDTIVTSEYNAVFPAGEMIGTVKEIKIKGDENFYNIEVKLSTDFNSISYVYIVRDKLKFQLDSLEGASTADRNETK